MPRTDRSTIQSHQEWSQAKLEIRTWQEIQPTSRVEHQDPEYQNPEESNNERKGKVKGKGETFQGKVNPGGSKKDGNTKSVSWS